MQLLSQIQPQKPKTAKQLIAEWRQNIPDLFNGSYRRLYDKAQTGKSRQAAMDSICLDCMCWQQAEVRNCTRVVCPLYLYRPYKADSAKNQASGTADSEETPFESPVEP